jgi:Clostripain family
MANGEAAWTVMVYMAGDNNLTEDMVWGLQELKKASAALEPRMNAETGRINVVAHFDPRGSRSRRYDFLPSGRPQGPGQEAGAQLGADGGLSESESAILTRRPEPPQPKRKAGKPQPEAGQVSLLRDPLATFIRDQLDRFQSEKYFLILSGHGSGAVGDFLIDSDPTTTLSIPKLAKILKAAKQQGRRLSILGMDSCLMSNAEVCCEISEQAELLVASEGWVANAGWPYHRVLEACFDAGAIDRQARSVAVRVAESYARFYRDYEISEISTDIAVCRLEAFRPGSALLTTLRSLSKALISAFDTAFVSDELDRTRLGDTASRHKRNAEQLSNALIQEIVELLPRAKRLRADLSNGSVRANRALREGLKAKRFTNRQWRVLRQLLRASGEGLGVDNRELEMDSINRPGRVSELFERPSSRSAALASVLLRRELDPGVNRALRLIESPQRYSRPETKQLRLSLQKYHQVQSVLELHQFARRPNTREVRDAKKVLDSVVLARWKAQSFKGGVYVDLVDFCNSLESQLPNGHKVRRLCARLRKLVGNRRRVVVASHQTGRDNQHANGLCVYFPYQTADYKVEYDNLALSQTTGWGRAVHSYLRATRRPRRNEGARWRDVRSHVLRFGHAEIDPLEADGIESRIVGVLTPPGPGNDLTRLPGKEGSEVKVRDGSEVKVRDGSEVKVREGSEAKVREGSEAKAKGEGVQFVWGNPPDGFYKQEPAN